MLHIYQHSFLYNITKARRADKKKTLAENSARGNLLSYLSVGLLDESRLLTGSIVLMQQTAGGSLIDLLHGKLVSGLGSFLVATLHRSVVLLDNLEVGHGIGESKKEAEQSAAQSVAKEMNDEICARLLDKLDKLESSASRA